MCVRIDCYGSAISLDPDVVLLFCLCRRVNYLYDMLKSIRWRNSRGKVINIITKFKRHFYYHCQQEHESGKVLRDNIMTFFEHIAGNSPDPNFVTQEWQNSPAWKSQLAGSEHCASPCCLRANSKICATEFSLRALRFCTA